MKEHVIDGVVPGSIASELGISPGDWLLSINGQEVKDVLDYHFFMNDEYLVVEVRTKDGEDWELEIEKEYEEDLGLLFGNGLMDDYRSCRNHCIFCFIDQMPKGMRETLYFKDDDSRLSFLQGNYVTLTNMSDEDVRRIIEYRMGPINISVHTTNPDLRCQMLNNRFAGRALARLRQLYEAQIPMNGQIVLCRHVNDGQELERTLRDLMAYAPVMESVSVVPVGLTRYRDGLYPLEPFTREEAREVLSMVRRFQDACYERFGLYFAHASDEWYLLAGEELPPAERYDGYPQLENGVGMLRLLEDEVEEALETWGEADAVLDTDAVPSAGTMPNVGAMLDVDAEHHGGLAGGTVAEVGDEPMSTHTVSIATGVLAAPHIRKLADRVEERFPGNKVLVYPVENRFFGEQITVSGLLTGQDLAAQLAGRPLGERLLLPCNMLRSGEEVFLDDMTLSELKETLQVPIDVVESNGHHFVASILRHG